MTFVFPADRRILIVLLKPIPAGALVHGRAEGVATRRITSRLTEVRSGVLQLVALVALTDVGVDAGPVDTRRVTIGNADAVFVLVELEATLTHIRLDATAVRAVIALGNAAERREGGGSRRSSLIRRITITYLVFVNSDSNS